MRQPAARPIQHPGHLRVAVEQAMPPPRDITSAPPEPPLARRVSAREQELMREYHFSPSEARQAARMIQNGEITCPN